MPSEGSRRRKFTQFMSDHIFRYEDGDMLFAVVHTMFNPTISGRIVELRAHVFISTFVSEAFAASTFFISLASTAAFFIDLDIFLIYSTFNNHLIRRWLSWFCNPEPVYPRSF